MLNCVSKMRPVETVGLYRAPIPSSCAGNHMGSAAKPLRRAFPPVGLAGCVVSSCTRPLLEAPSWPMRVGGTRIWRFLHGGAFQGTCAASHPHSCASPVAVSPLVTGQLTPRTWYGPQDSQKPRQGGKQNSGQIHKRQWRQQKACCIQNNRSPRQDRRIIRHQDQENILGGRHARTR